MFNLIGRRKEAWTCRAVPWRRCCNVWWVFKRKWQKLSWSYQNVSTICNNNLLVEIIYILLFISLLWGRASTQNVSFRDSLQWSIHKFTSSTQLLKLNYLLYYPSNAAFSFRDYLQTVANSQIYIIDSVAKTKQSCYVPPLMQHHSFFRNIP